MTDKPQTLAEQPVEWRSINTAPRGGEWFFARTIRGTIRYVHFADKYDRFPISHDGVVWETAPLEWTLDAAAALADAAPSYQARVKPWLDACFGPEIAGDKTERNHRFLEEALELVQAGGCTASEAHQLVDYVYGRPVGEMGQEVGGVMNTLAALCLAYGRDMHEDGETELARVWTMVEKIRAKQAAKPKHSPLPGYAATTPVVGAEQAGDVRQAVRVKPLEWFEAQLPSRGGGKWQSSGYTIRKIEGLFLVDFAGDSKADWHFTTLEAAQYFAYAHKVATITAALEPDPMPAVSASSVEALSSYQQADADGVMVQVSRQAIEECLPSLRALAERGV